MSEIVVDKERAVILVRVRQLLARSQNKGWMMEFAILYGSGAP